MALGAVHVHDVSAWIATVIGAITLVSLLATLAVRAIKNETIKAVNENNEALKERANELGTEKDALQQEVANERGKRSELERQLHERPDFTEVIRLFNEGIEHLDGVAARRQEKFVALVLERNDQHNEIVAEHYRRLAEAEKQRQQVNEEILAAIGQLTDAVERMSP